VNEPTTASNTESRTSGIFQEIGKAGYSVD